MANKNTSANKKRGIEKPPTLAEKITDTSKGALTNVRFIPKKKTGK